MFSCYEGIWPSLKTWDFLNVVPKHQMQQTGVASDSMCLRQILIEPSSNYYNGRYYLEKRSGGRRSQPFPFPCSNRSRMPACYETDCFILLLHEPAMWFLLNPVKCSSWCLAHQLNCIQMTLNLKLMYFLLFIVKTVQVSATACTAGSGSALCPECCWLQSLTFGDISTDFTQTSPIWKIFNLEMFQSPVFWALILEVADIQIANAQPELLLRSSCPGFFGCTDYF